MMAVELEQPPQRVTRIVLIFDQQYAFRARRRKRLTIGRRCVRMIDLHAQHSDREYGTFANTFAFGADAAMLRLDQRLGDRETKTQAAARAIERLIALHEYLENTR